MRAFVIEVYWPDMTSELVAGLVARTTEALASNESAIRYVGCEVAPWDETCFLRVIAADGQLVQELVDALDLDGARVSELVRAPGHRPVGLRRGHRFKDTRAVPRLPA